MEIKSLSGLREAVAGGRRKTAVVAAANDVHTLEAVFRASEDGLLDYILIGEAGRIRETADVLRHRVKDGQIIDTADTGRAAEAAVRLVNEGQGDFIVKGFMQTAELLRAVVNREHGLGNGSVMSHVALLEIAGYHKLLSVTDGGMIPSPDLEAKRAIIENAVEIHHRLGFAAPKVAVCCASEAASEKITETVDAAELKQMNRCGAISGCVVEGPISIDLALSERSAAAKGYSSPVGGDADIVVVPGITAGNMFVKGLLLFAGAKMTGCIAGARCPVAVNSRSASFEEKYYSLMLCALQ